MKRDKGRTVRRALILIVGTLLLAVGMCATTAVAAAKRTQARLAVSWPNAGFPGYRLVVTGRATGWSSGAFLALEHRQGRGWRRVAVVHLTKADSFVVSWKAPKAVGPIGLRLVVVRRSRVFAQRSARVDIRPLPIVIPAKDIVSVPQPGQAGWIRFKHPGGLAAHDARLSSDCVPIPAGPQLYGKKPSGNFVSVGYNKDSSPDGFLGRIDLVHCNGVVDGLYATPVTLNEAYPGGSFDLAGGFTEVAGGSSSATASRTFTTTVGQVPCSGGASATLSGSVGFQFSPTFKASFSGLSLSSATFELRGKATATVGVDANAGATCSPNDVPLFPRTTIGTFQGVVGPFYVVVELRGELDLSGSLHASVAASDQITATADVKGGVEYSNGTFTPIGGSTFSLVNTGPTVHGTATASATITPKVQALLYGAAGPELDLNAGLRLTADSTAAHCWTLDAPVSADAAFVGFGKTWASHDFDIADEQWQARGPCTGGPPLLVSITNPGAQTGRVGTPTTLQVRASDMDGSALRYSATGLPAGLSIDASTGIISGAPATAGTSTVTVTASDVSGPSDSTSFSWSVLGPQPNCDPSAGPPGTFLLPSSNRSSFDDYNWSVNGAFHIRQFNDPQAGLSQEIVNSCTGEVSAAFLVTGDGVQARVADNGTVVYEAFGDPTRIYIDSPGEPQPILIYTGPEVYPQDVQISQDGSRVAYLTAPSGGETELHTYDVMQGTESTVAIWNDNPGALIPFALVWLDATGQRAAMSFCKGVDSQTTSAQACTDYGLQGTWAGTGLIALDDAMNPTMVTAPGDTSLVASSLEAVSPDGSMFALEGYASDGSATQYVYRPASGLTPGPFVDGTQCLVTEVSDENLPARVFSSNGQYLGCEASGTLYLVDIETGNATTIQTGGSFVDVEWVAPDGSGMIFRSDLDGSVQTYRWKGSPP